MNDHDKQRFVDAITECAAIYGETLTPERLASYWRLLAHLTVETVAAAIDAHMRDPDRGRFFPRPADIIAAVQQGLDDGRPSPDEAWAIALRAEDEQDTLVWTDEIAEAWGAARPILAVGDRVGARQAFLAAYRRLLERARGSGRRVAWTVSPGRDIQRRRAAIAEAVAAGRLSADAAKALLPPPEEPGELAQGIAGLVTGKVTPMPQNAEVRKNIARLRRVVEDAAQRAEARAAGKQAEADQARERQEAERRRQLDALAAKMTDDHDAA